MDFYFTEAYFGISKNIDRMIQSLTVIESMLRKDIHATITNSPENIELESSIKDQFGFRTVAVCWTRWDEANGGGACTPIPTSKLICHAKGLKPNIVPNKTGYYDSKHVNGLVVMVSPALFTRSNLTPREMCGVILHEIGHNFDVSVYTTIPFVAQIAMSVYAILQNNYQISKAIDQLPYNMATDRDKMIMRAQLAKDTVRDATVMALNVGLQNGPLGQAVYAGTHSLIEAIREKAPFLVKLEELFTKMNGLYRMVFGKVYYVLNRVRIFAAMGTWWRVLLYSPLAHLTSVGTRKKEIFADSFAAAYGLGPELVSGLSKLENDGSIVYYKNKLKSSGVIKDGNILFTIVEDINSAWTTLIQTFDACDHGTNIDRMNKVLKKIRQEIKDPSLSARAKVELLSQLEELEKFEKSYYSGVSEGRHMYLTWLVRHLVKILGGTDWIADLLPKNEA